MSDLSKAQRFVQLGGRWTEDIRRLQHYLSPGKLWLCKYQLNTDSFKRELYEIPLRAIVSETDPTAILSQTVDIPLLAT